MVLGRELPFHVALRGVSAPTLAIGAIIATVILAAWVNFRGAESARLATHSLDIRANAERVLGQIRDAETGQRGYLLTGDRKFLEPYEAAVRVAPIEIDSLARLVADNPEQAGRVAEMRQVIDEKMAELRAAIDAFNRSERASAVAIIARGTGKVAMDRIRDIIRDMKIAEDELRARRDENAQQRRLIGSILSIAILSLLVFLGWRQISVTIQRNRELDEANVALEERVEARTAELSSEKLRVEALLSDVSHRVGNNLAMVSALISLQARQSDSPQVKQELEKAQLRIQAIAAGQRRLRLHVETDEVDARPYLEDVLAEISRAMGERAVSISLDMEDIRLSGREAVSYVVLVNELVTNALKHAFPNGMAGTIRVGLHRSGDTTGGLILSVEDDGVGQAPAKPSTGLGSQVIASMTRSMRGEAASGPAHPGAERQGWRTTIRFAPRTEAAPAA
ncbi:MAG: CHASE3 domain-containing protein [Phreatobacter sp.]|uniref:sensor histidine kinase n=1 Tax=Phreatobacter sp. TaxID=1966341 RepID=UPI001A561D00|nr:CHASE3 domain-containing protein [Phreatobacter sp.]MBL8567898.1 CHASE3 domain-containing protein [Phreatobacter sp.]